MADNSTLKQTTTYTFKYNSDSDSIDLNTLLLSQIHFGTILSEIKNEVAADANLSIKIKPLAKGSVPFDIVLNVSWLQSLFSHENIAYSSAIVSTLVGIIQLKIWSKGEKPTKIIIKDGKVTVTIGNNVIEVDQPTYSLYEKNAIVDLALKKAFEVIEKDEDVTGVEILDVKKEKLIEIPRDQFQDIASDNKIFDELAKTESATTIPLVINKVVFEKGYKWAFYMNGRKISAGIDDSDFMERINRGERFSKGDVLVVEMEVEKVYDKSVDTYIEKGFKIIKVLQHIPRPEQSSLL